MTAAYVEIDRSQLGPVPSEPVISIASDEMLVINAAVRQLLSARDAEFLEDAAARILSSTGALRNPKAFEREMRAAEIVMLGGECWDVMRRAFAAGYPGVTLTAKE